MSKRITIVKPRETIVVALDPNKLKEISNFILAVQSQRYQLDGMMSEKEYKNYVSKYKFELYSPSRKGTILALFNILYFNKKLNESEREQYLEDLKTEYHKKYYKLLNECFEILEEPQEITAEVQITRKNCFTGEDITYITKLGKRIARTVKDKELSQEDIHNIALSTYSKRALAGLKANPPKIYNVDGELMTLKEYMKIKNVSKPTALKQLSNNYTINN